MVVCDISVLIFDCLHDVSVQLSEHEVVHVGVRAFDGLLDHTTAIRVQRQSEHTATQRLRKMSAMLSCAMLEQLLDHVLYTTQCTHTTQTHAHTEAHSQAVWNEQMHD